MAIPKEERYTVEEFLTMTDEGLNDCKQYTFVDRIPVYIFKDFGPPLEICVGNYL